MVGPGGASGDDAPPRSARRTTGDTGAVSGPAAGGETSRLPALVQAWGQNARAPVHEWTGARAGIRDAVDGVSGGRTAARYRAAGVSVDAGIASGADAAGSGAGVADIDTMRARGRRTFRIAFRVSTTSAVESAMR